jgi:hypothetical protein
MWEAYNFLCCENTVHQGNILLWIIRRCLEYKNATHVCTNTVENYNRKRLLFVTHWWFIQHRAIDKEAER